VDLVAPGNLSRKRIAFLADLTIQVGTPSQTAGECEETHITHMPCLAEVVLPDIAERKVVLCVLHPPTHEHVVFRTSRQCAHAGYIAIGHHSLPLVASTPVDLGIRELCLVVMP